LIDRGKDFRADTGFIPQVDVESHNLNVSRIWYPDGSRWWNRISVGGNSGAEHDTSGRMLQRWKEAFLGIQGPLQSNIQTAIGSSTQFWNGIYYDVPFAFVSARFRPVGGLNIQFLTNQGDQIDFANSRLGDWERYRIQLDWNANRHLLIRLQRTDTTLDTKEGPNVFAAVLDDVRLTWQFNVRNFLRLTMQRQQISRNLAVWSNPFVDAYSENVGTQLLYSYKLNPQTVVFAGYSDTQIQDDDLLSLTRTGRTFFVKFSYAWLP
jgi:hypothetical protein